MSTAEHDAQQRMSAGDGADFSGASAPELQLILTYVVRQIEASEQFLSEPSTEELERYWRHWLTQYIWWRDKCQTALDALAQQEGEG